MKHPLIIITGPTAVGKTALSIQLAGQIGGEIISADSMQVYRHMNIGSAKVTKEEMGGIRHHLIDILDPSEEFNVVLFQRLAKVAMEEIRSRGHIPIVAGGTGFYIQALLYAIDFTETSENHSLREELERIAGEQGPEALHKLLFESDPESAAVIHANNVKRVIRALEFYRQTGQKISEHNEREHQKESPYNFLYYVVNTDRQVLYERIERRVDQMMENGLVDEVKRLKDMGCTSDMLSMQGLGYKEVLSYLDGTCSLSDASYIIKRDTRHFAKRQLTWFKRERDVRWLNRPEYNDNDREILTHVISECRDNGMLGCEDAGKE